MNVNVSDRVFLVREIADGCFGVFAAFCLCGVCLSVCHMSKVCCCFSFEFECLHRIPSFRSQTVTLLRAVIKT